MLWGLPRAASRRSLITIPWRARCQCQSRVPTEKWCLRSGSTSGSGRSYTSLSHDGKRKDLDGFEHWAEKETVKIRTGGAGTVKVDIFNPSLLSDPATPLLIFLPPTGAHLSNEHPPIPSYLLTNHSSLARINYRWNIASSSTTSSSTQQPGPFGSPHSHPFPIPIHDTLLAYSHLLTRFNPSPPSPPSPQGRKLYISPRPSPRKHIARPILIYGSFLGGSLATSLALTESFSSKQHPVHISGLISKSGVYDWIEAGTQSLTSPPTENVEFDLNGGWDITTLICFRESLFSNPASCFDPFASPTLFFRTAGISVPKSWSNLSPSSSISLSENGKRVSTALPGAEPDLDSEVGIWDDYSDSNPNFLNTDNKNTQKETLDLNPVAKRAHLKFPTKDSGLIIPRTLFLYNEAKQKGKKKKGEEARQAEDMASLLRRSIVQHEFKERKVWDEELDAMAVAGERVRACSVPISGSGNEEERVIREWIEEALG